MDDSEKTELTPANDNPWYWLATAYGEQTGDDIDEDLAKKNRIAWNRWVAEVLSEEKRATLIEEGFDAAELTPFSDNEKKDHYAAVLKRSGREAITLPEPSESADFYLNRFDHSCHFGGYIFPIEVNFRSAKFCGNGYFRLAKFNGKADFRSTIFSEFAVFGLAAFCREAFFGSATFSGKAYFWSATFSKRADFKSAEFDFNADFVNTKFLSQTTFSEAVFRDNVPKFFGATLHEGTAWDGVKWPSPPNNLNDGKKIEVAQQQVYAYERLKQEMEKLKKHENEQFFFRKELRARRELYTQRSIYWWLNLFYQGLSDYGYDVLRPLRWFSGLFVVGFLLFAFDPLEFTGKKLTKWEAAFTSLANMFGSLPLKTLANYTTDKTFAYSAEIFAIFQTIAGAVLLFLFFVALRNRFRLR